MLNLNWYMPEHPFPALLIRALAKREPGEVAWVDFHRSNAYSRQAVRHSSEASDGWVLSFSVPRATANRLGIRPGPGVGSFVRFDLADVVAGLIKWCDRNRLLMPDALRDDAQAFLLKYDRRGVHDDAG